MINAEWQAKPFDLRWSSPGFVGTTGTDRSIDELGQVTYALRDVVNFEPTTKGFSVSALGVKAFLPIRPTNAKVQAGFGWKNFIYHIANGNLYRTDLTTLATTVVGANQFNLQGRRVRYAFNLGSGLPKVYLVDGTSIAKVLNLNGNTIAPVPNMPPNFNIPQTVITYKERTVYTYPRGTERENTLLFSNESDGDTYSIAGVAAVDGFTSDVFVGDNDWIIGLGVVSFTGKDTQDAALIAVKSRRSFMATSITTDSTGSVTVFGNEGVDIGGISPDAIVQFGNDLWIMTATGVKGFRSAVEGSGGVAAFLDSATPNLDALFVQAAENVEAFAKSFVIHNPDSKKIRFFVPESAVSSASQNGFNYGETPLDSALCYGYSIFPATETNPKGESYWQRKGAGFAFSCAWIHNKITYLGDYFGNVYIFDTEESGNDYVQVAPGVRQPVISTMQTPYMTFDEPFDTQKRFLDLALRGIAPGQVQITTQILHRYNRKPFQRNIPEKTQIAGVAANQAVYGTAIYGTDKYGSEGGGLFQFKIPCIGMSNAISVKIIISNTRFVDGDFKPNVLTLTGMTGWVEIGAIKT